MDLTESLHAAVADPPPSAINLDRLILHEVRRADRNRWLTSAGALVSVAAVVAVLWTGLPHVGGLPSSPGVDSSPLPCVGPSPGQNTDIGPADSPGPSLVTVKPAPTGHHPTTCGAIEAQLSRTVRDAVAAVAPNAVLVDVVHFRSWNPRYYTTSVSVRDKGLDGWFSVIVQSVDVPANGLSTVCVTRDDPCTEIQSDFFAGHTHVRIFIKPDDGDGPPPTAQIPLTTDQIARIAVTPDFVVFP